MEGKNIAKIYLIIGEWVQQIMQLDDSDECFKQKKSQPNWLRNVGTRKGNRTPVLAVRGPCPNL